MDLLPLRTEKTIKEAEGGRYTFRVSVAVTKPQIKREIEKVFKVKVTAVQTAIMPGKAYRAGKKGSYATRSDWKKAIVTLAKGQKMDIYGA